MMRIIQCISSRGEHDEIEKDVTDLPRNKGQINWVQMVLRLRVPG